MLQKFVIVGYVSPGGLPCPFFKIEEKCPNLAKKCPDFGRKYPVCMYLLVNLLLKIMFYWKSWRKNTKIFPCETLLLFVVHETFIELLLFQETFPAPRNSCLRAWRQFVINIRSIRNCFFLNHLKPILITPSTDILVANDGKLLHN